jgi:hypothetical protein
LRLPRTSADTASTACRRCSTTRRPSRTAESAAGPLPPLPPGRGPGWRGTVGWAGFLRVVRRFGRRRINRSPRLKSREPGILAPCPGGGMYGVKGLVLDGPDDLSQVRYPVTNSHTFTHAITHAHGVAHLDTRPQSHLLRQSHPSAIASFTTFRHPISHSFLLASVASFSNTSVHAAPRSTQRAFVALHISAPSRTLGASFIHPRLPSQGHDHVHTNLRAHSRPLTQAVTARHARNCVPANAYRSKSPNRLAGADRRTRTPGAINTRTRTCLRHTCSTSGSSQKYPFLTKQPPAKTKSPAKPGLTGSADISPSTIDTLHELVLHGERLPGC